MNHDTTKDPRIIVARLACAQLKICVNQKAKVALKANRGQLAKLAAACEAATMTLTYLYQPPDALVESESVENLGQAVTDLLEGYEPLLSLRDDHSMLKARVRWSLRTLGGLGKRLTNPGTTLASGVDLLAVKLLNVTGQGNLSRTRVTDGRGDFVVMTNIPGVATNSVLAVAFLPPREVGGNVSEAMFLGGERRQEAAGTFLMEGQVDASEATSILYDEVSKLH